MYSMIHTIKIETESSYAGRSDTYTVEACGESITITHEIGGFMHKKVKPETKKVSTEEFSQIEAAFDKLDLTKIYKESGGNFGCDGWTLKCTIGQIMSNISVMLWCPSKHKEYPETTKLLRACDMIFSLFPWAEK